MRANVIELLDRDGAMPLDGVNHFSEMGNDRIVGVSKIAACQNGCCMDRHGLNDDHRGPADGPFGIVGGVPFGRQALDRHVGGVCAEDDPVVQCVRAQLERREQSGKFFDIAQFQAREQSLKTGRQGQRCTPALPKIRPRRGGRRRGR